MSLPSLDWALHTICFWLCSVFHPRDTAAASCPDFLEPDELQTDEQAWAEWSDHVARHPSTLDHLRRCLEKRGPERSER
jgi:hypothetical protein